MSGAAKLRLYGPDTRYGARKRPGVHSSSDWTTANCDSMWEASSSGMTTEYRAT